MRYLRALWALIRDPGLDRVAALIEKGIEARLAIEARVEGLETMIEPVARVFDSMSRCAECGAVLFGSYAIRYDLEPENPEAPIESACRFCKSRFESRHAGPARRFVDRGDGVLVLKPRRSAASTVS